MEMMHLSWKTLGEEGNEQFAFLGNYYGRKTIQTYSIDNA
jgi:hypothetical protein